MVGRGSCAKKCRIAEQEVSEWLPRKPAVKPESAEARIEQAVFENLHKGEARLDGVRPANVVQAVGELVSGIRVPGPC